MSFCRHVIVFVALNCICVNLVQTVSNICNKNEFLQAETGSCVVCTVCDIKLELVTWIPCTNDTDTICGPQFHFGEPTNSRMKSGTKHNTVLFNNERSPQENEWMVLENTVIGVLIGAGLMSVLIVVTACFLRRRRRKNSQMNNLKLCPYSIARMEEVRSIQELAEEREFEIEEHGNIYVKTGDIQATTRSV